MKRPPMPPLTLDVLAGAVADLIRASAVWGCESTQKEPDERTYVMVVQCATQLVALVKRSDPTDDEMTAVFQQLGAPPPS